MQGDNQFRVKLILGHYFADHKANSYICVNRDWNTVKDLHLHIKNLFDIDGFVLKTTENVYLPDKENINVIQRGDDISAIPHDVAKNGAKMSSVNTIRSDNQRKSMDSFNPFSPPKSTDKDPTHTNLKASEKCLKPSNVNDGDGLLDVRRRKRTRKHKNSKDKSKTDSNGGDTSVSELSPKIRSSKIINVSAERKMNGTSKPTANKHVSKPSFTFDFESDSDINVGASTSEAFYDQCQSPSKPISIHDTSTDYEIETGILRKEEDLLDPKKYVLKKKNNNKNTNKNIQIEGTVKTKLEMEYDDLKDNYSDRSEYRKANEGLSTLSPSSSVIFVGQDGEPGGFDAIVDVKPDMSDLNSEFVSDMKPDTKSG